MNLVFYTAIVLIQLVTYTFLRSLGSASTAAFVSFFPVLIFALYQNWRTWPGDEGPRLQRFFQDFILSLGAAMALFLAVMMFQFFIVALGVEAKGFFAELIGVMAFIAFWATFAFIFHLQRNKAQHLGMNWAQLQPPDDDPSVDFEYSTMNEIEEALHLLNLDADLDEKSLRDRYHQLSLLYHPDRMSSMGDKTRNVAEKEFQRIQNAYELLKVALKNSRL